MRKSEVFFYKKYRTIFATRCGYRQKDFGSGSLVGGDFDTIVPVASLKAYEKSLQSQGKKVESLYGPWQHSYEYYAMTKRAAEFFVKYAGAAATE